MGKCNIDHSKEDVAAKYEAQSSYLPVDMKRLFADFFEKEASQETLNEVFHLLKKYDLADAEEQERRNQQLYLLIK